MEIIKVRVIKITKIDRIDSIGMLISIMKDDLTKAEFQCINGS